MATLPVLNRKLVLEEAQHVPDGAGGFSESWVALGTLWAAVTAGSGTEARWARLTRVSRTRHRIVVRAAAHGAPSRPRADQRFRDGARVFRILSVDRI